MDEPIKDKNLGWRWRAYIGQYMNLDSFNLVQLQAWKGELEHPHLRLTDATAYETPYCVPDLSEAFDRLYGYESHPILKVKGKKIAVRVVSQFGEESTLVRTI